MPPTICNSAGGDYLGDDVACTDIPACPGVYAVDFFGTLWWLDEDNAAASEIGSLGGQVVALTQVPGTGGVLYGVELRDGADFLVIVDINTVAITQTIGEIVDPGRPSLDDVWGLAYDQDDDQLYGITSNLVFVTIDLATAEANAVGEFSIGMTTTTSLAWNPEDGLLYTVENWPAPDNAVLWGFDLDWPTFANPAARSQAEIQGVFQVGGLTYFEGMLGGVTQDEPASLIAFTDPTISAEYEDRGQLETSTFVGLAGFELSP
jgi:hypothetical protein